jgi:hypothetical protein
MKDEVVYTSEDREGRWKRLADILAQGVYLHLKDWGLLDEESGRRGNEEVRTCNSREHGQASEE